MTREVKFPELSEVDKTLVISAQEASRNAYAPYSGFAVGAAVRTKNGEIYAGANLENASYGLAICGEISAITAANSAGEFDVEAIAIVGFSFIDRDAKMAITTPCGRCRQIIFEASEISKIDIKIFACSGDLRLITESHISEWLPSAFGPSNLGFDKKWPKMQNGLWNLIDKMTQGRRQKKRAVG